MLKESNIKKSKFESFRRFVKAHKLLIIISAAGVLIVGVAVIVLIILFEETPELESIVPDEPTVSAPPPVETPKYFSILTGLPLASEAMQTAATTCIMIENSPSARPQSGIKAASIVFEAIAEGGITRFLTVFQNADTALIGPVRSIRPYYVDWLTPFNCSIAHVGGSDEALAMVRNNSAYRDIDQFFNDAAYWRASNRSAPHNVYTNFERLDVLNQTKGYLESNPVAFSRYEDAPQRSEDAVVVGQINLKISNALYNPVYTYDEATNTYLRAYQNGALHMDVDAAGVEGQASPSVVVAILVAEYRADDGHENITTTGTGKAYIFQNGVAIEAEWQKLARDQQIEFFGLTGESITFVPGQMWITAIPKGSGSISYQ